MAYSITLRQRVEALLLGTYGTGRTMQAGRFHLNAPDDQDYASTAERRVNVTVGPRKRIGDLTPNPLDGYVLYEHPVTVVIEYARTHAGGDLAERLGEQGNPGTDEAIMDRMTSDQHDVEMVLGWYANWSGLDPDLFNLKADPGSASKTDMRGQVAKLTLNYVAWVQATSATPGTYSP